MPFTFLMLQSKHSGNTRSMIEQSSHSRPSWTHQNETWTNMEKILAMKTLDAWVWNLKKKKTNYFIDGIRHLVQLKVSFCRIEMARLCGPSAKIFMWELLENFRNILLVRIDGSLPYESTWISCRWLATAIARPSAATILILGDQYW